MFKYLLPLLLLTASIWQQSSAVTVYDCEHPGTTFQPIDLLEPEECPDPVSGYEIPKPVRVQVLQSEAASPVVGYNCRITITKRVHRCGFNSLHYGFDTPVYKENVVLTPAECRKAIRETRIKIEGKIHPVQLGVVMNSKFFSHGLRRSDGTCETATFTTNGQYFEKSYEECLLEIFFRKIPGTVDRAEGVVIFNNGLRANYMDEVLRDSAEGVIVWAAEKMSCVNSVSEIYMGDATLHRRRNKGRDGSIIMIENNATKQYAGLVLRHSITMCRKECHATHIPGLSLCILRPRDRPITGAEFKAHFDPTTMDIATQLSYSHLGTNLRMYSRFEEMSEDLCALDRRSLFNKLQAVSGADNTYALLDMFGRGHTVFVAGAAAYVARCVPLQGVVANYPNCTHEIPIRVNGSGNIRFADAFSFILSDLPTRIPCSDVMPVRWKIDDEWWCATPQARRCNAPAHLNVSTVAGMQAVDFTEGLGAGVLTTEQRSQHHFYVLLSQSRLAGTNELTQNMLRNRDTGTAFDEFGHPFNPAALGTFRLDIAGLIFPMFWVLGEWWTYLSGALLFGLCIKIVASVIIRGWIIYKAEGFGCWMLAAFWDTLFLLARTPWTVLKKTTEAITEPLKPGFGFHPRTTLEVSYAKLQEQLDELRAKQDEIAEELSAAAQAHEATGSTMRDGYAGDAPADP
jgi:hypothetical protein